MDSQYLPTSITVPNPNSTLPARQSSAEPKIDENVTRDQEKNPTPSVYLDPLGMNRQVTKRRVKKTSHTVIVSLYDRHLELQSVILIMLVTLVGVLRF
jgi:hypothetical protein